MIQPEGVAYRQHALPHQQICRRTHGQRLQVALQGSNTCDLGSKVTLRGMHSGAEGREAGYPPLLPSTRLGLAVDGKHRHVRVGVKTHNLGRVLLLPSY